MTPALESVSLPESAGPAVAGMVQFGDGACFRFTAAADCTVTLHADSRRHAQSGTCMTHVSSPAREAALRRHIMDIQAVRRDAANGTG